MFSNWNDLLRYRHARIEYGNVESYIDRTYFRTFFSFASSCGSLKTFITQKNHLPPISHLCHLHPWSSFPMSHPKSNKRWTENGRTLVGLLFADRCVCFTLIVLYRWKSNKVMCFWFMKDQNATFQSNSTFHLTKSDITLLLRPLPLGYIFSSFGLPPIPTPISPPRQVAHFLNGPL